MIRALPAGLRRFALADIPPEPWRNGGGLTRTVAAGHSGAALQWRVSAADIARDGDFSVFDGVDRQAVLMRGAGLRLQGPHDRWVFHEAGDLHRFPGETPLRASLGSGPARLWNVMVARDLAWAEVRVDELAHTVEVPAPGADVMAVVVVLEGLLQVSVGGESELLTLSEDEGLVMSNPSPSIDLRPLTARTRWIHTALRRHVPMN